MSGSSINRLVPGEYDNIKRSPSPFASAPLYGIVQRSMIPAFPEFKGIELADRTAIESLTLNFLPYSDFDFTSLYSWDVKGAVRVSMLHGNLVVQFADYLTDKQFFSFIGRNNINETASDLLHHAAAIEISLQLKFIPQEIGRLLDKVEFKIQEDRDSFDYIYDTNEHSTFSGGAYSQRRNELNAFSKSHPNAEARNIELNDLDNQKQMLSVYSKWADKKIADARGFEHNEEMSFLRLMAMINQPKHELEATGVYNENKLIAFCIYEKKGKYAVGHTAKSDITIKGANAFLMQRLAKKLISESIEYFNFEQDLGVANLRTSKERYRPVFFLKKYIVEFA